MNESDEFEAQVRGHVEMFASFDALEFPLAVRVAIDVFVNTVLQYHDAKSVGRARGGEGESPYRASLAGVVAPIVAWVGRNREASVQEVAWEIVEACFDEVEGREYLDTHEITWLVGVTRAVALELWEKEPQLAVGLLR